jgi:hypothetical protein
MAAGCCARRYRGAALTISLRFLARAREGGSTSSPAERAADAAPSDTRAANQIAGLSTSFFVCSISVGRCRLIAARSDTPDDHFRFRKFGSRRVMDSISRPAVVWWWSRASYGVSPTTPPIETAPTMGLSRPLSLSLFGAARRAPRRPAPAVGAGGGAELRGRCSLAAGCCAQRYRGALAALFMRCGYTLLRKASAERVHDVGDVSRAQRWHSDSARRNRRNIQ